MNIFSTGFVNIISKDLSTFFIENFKVTFVILRKSLKFYWSQLSIWDYYHPKNVPSKFLLKTLSTDLVEGIQSDKSIGYCLIFFTCIRNSLPMKTFPIENFKIAVDSSQIAHSIGNFILKNFKTRDFSIKWICEEIWRNM